MAQHKRIQNVNLPTATLDRRQAVPALIPNPLDFLVIAGLAGAAQELTALTNDGANVYGLAGAMGAALGMGLGLALSQPNRKILAITGDGELLMSLGALATCAVLDPPNLRIVCVDNGHYGETGNQESHTGLGVQLDKIAAGAGFAVVHTIHSEADIAEGRRLLNAETGLCFILLRVKIGPALKMPRSLDPAFTRNRFRMALLGKA